VRVQQRPARRSIAAASTTSTKSVAQPKTHAKKTARARGKAPVALAPPSAQTSPPPARSLGWQAEASSLHDETKKLLGDVKLEFTDPPKGASVLHAEPGRTPLIGLPSDFLDASKSYEDNLARFKKEGIPRFATLDAESRAHETAFADAVQADPEKFIEGANVLAHSGAPAAAVFETDAEKRLYGPYGTSSKPADDAQRAVRSLANNALHPTATAIARLAFLKELDGLQKLPEGDPKRTLLMTTGGCAAGKSDLAALIKRQIGDVPFGAVWDAAGEGDALENGWVLEAAQARGLKVIVGFAANDPKVQYHDVLTRALASGRVVDPLTFTNSYVDGTANMKAFLESPLYKSAAEKGEVTTFGMFVGPNNPKQFSDPTAKAYPHARTLGKDGVIVESDIPPMPDKASVFEAVLHSLERFVGEQKAQGNDVSWLVRAALLPEQKFERSGDLKTALG
jgi:hypothetical protein